MIKTCKICGLTKEAIKMNGRTCWACMKSRQRHKPMDKIQYSSLWTKSNIQAYGQGKPMDNPMDKPMDNPMDNPMDKPMDNPMDKATNVITSLHPDDYHPITDEEELLRRIEWSEQQPKKAKSKHRFLADDDEDIITPEEEAENLAALIRLAR